jgi:hypothetical protein
MKMTTSAPGNLELPTPPRSLWGKDLAKSVFLVALVASAIAAILSFIDNRVAAAVDAKLLPVRENIVLAREDLIYLHARSDAQSADLTEIKESVARVDKKLKE